MDFFGLPEIWAFSHRAANDGFFLTIGVKEIG
jgi:hypothetical protein